MRAEKIDSRARACSRPNHLGGEIAQRVVEVAPLADIVEQVLPVVGTSTATRITAIGAVAAGPTAGRLAGPPRRALVAEVADQKFNEIINERARFLLAGVGQLLTLGLAGFAAVPAIQPLAIGVNASDDDLLTMAEKFDLLALAPVQRNEVDDDLVERLVSAERDGALGRQADAHQDRSGIFVTVVHQVLAGTHCLLIQNVEIERRNVAREHAGIDRVGPRLRPHNDHVVRNGDDVGPAGKPLALVVLAVDRRLFAVERNRTVTRGDERAAQRGRFFDGYGFRRRRGLGVILGGISRFGFRDCFLEILLAFGLGLAVKLALGLLDRAQVRGIVSRRTIAVTLRARRLQSFGFAKGAALAATGTVKAVSVDFDETCDRLFALGAIAFELAVGRVGDEAHAALAEKFVDRRQIHDCLLRSRT